MHIITYTNRSGSIRHITFKASQLNDAFSFIRTLQKNRIVFKHVFEE